MIFDYGLTGVDPAGATDPGPSLMAAIDQRPGIRPRASLGRRLDIAARFSFPACVTILLMLFHPGAIGDRGQAALLPAVALCCVWFWSLFRPAAMPPPMVFLIGLLLDLLGYLPPGVGVLTLLAVHGLRFDHASVIARARIRLDLAGLQRRGGRRVATASGSWSCC